MSEVRSAASVKRRYEFDRYRNGRLMAEGIVVHAFDLDEAVEKALRLRDSHADTIELRPEPIGGE